MRVDDELRDEFFLILVRVCVGGGMSVYES